MCSQSSKSSHSYGIPADAKYSRWGMVYDMMLEANEDHTYRLATKAPSFEYAWPALTPRAQKIAMHHTKIR